MCQNSSYNSQLASCHVTSGSLLMVQRGIETPWNVSELQFLGRALGQTNNILDWGVKKICFNRLTWWLWFIYKKLRPNLEKFLHYL